MRRSPQAGIGALALGLFGCAVAQPMVAGKTVSPEFDVQGHRGARGLAPENTLPAIELALDAGVSTLELDLHLSRDDVLVVWHDPVLSAAKCEGPGLDDPATSPRIRDLRYRELAAYNCNLNPDPTLFPRQRAEPTPLIGDDFRITRLEAVLDFIVRYADAGQKTGAQRANAGSVRLNLELKRSKDEPWWIDDGFDGLRPATLEQALIRLLRQRDMVERVTVQSFDHRSLAAIHGVAPEVELAALTEDAADLPALRALGASIWSPHHTAVTRDNVAASHALGLRVVPWTVNSAARAAELIDMGVDGIITDLGGDVTFSDLGIRSAGRDGVPVSRKSPAASRPGAR